jgi:hypothetical protein
MGRKIMAPPGDTPGHVADWRAGMVIIASFIRRSWPALG